jgi:PAS domain S-box-containing protein
MVVELEKAFDERKQVREGLYEKSTILFQIMENLPVGIFVADAEGRPYYENMVSRELNGNAMTTISSVAVNQLLGVQQFYRLGTNQEYPESKTPLARALAGEETVVDDIEVRKPGRNIPLEVHATPIFDDKGRVAFAVVTLRDITRRKKNEEKLRDYAKEIQVLTENLSKRLVQKIGQMDNLSMIRDKLRKCPDVSTGLDLVLEAALNDLDMDVGAVLLVDNAKNALIVRGFKSRVEGFKLEENYALNSDFVEFEAIRSRETVSKIVGQSELSILGAASIHCAPIYLCKDLCGLIVLGSEKGAVLDSSDQTVLGLYATLASTVFESQSLAITPVKETTRKINKRFNLEPGYVYIVKDDVEKAFEIFADNVLAGTEGLCITRQFPPKVRKSYGLEKTPIVWLTDEKVEGQISIQSLQDLSIAISNFLEKVSRSIMLLDGFEYLITNNGFDAFLRFLQLTRARFEVRDSILIAPLMERALDTKHIRLIERETRNILRT